MIISKYAPVFLLTYFVVSLALSAPYNDGSDYSFYITRPDIRPPKLIVKTYDYDAVLPGYIFTAPYQHLTPTFMKHGFFPGQIGPHIYDNRGELVWAGAEAIQNFVATNFKPVIINSSIHLTFILQEIVHRTIPKPKAFILNSNYDVVQTVDYSRDFDLHEFVVLNNGTSFLRVIQKEATTEKILLGETVTILNTCAGEVDALGNEIFSFCPAEKLGMDETMVRRPNDSKLRNETWDLFHMNSVDKFPGGDFLASIRYASTIYRVSRTSGEVVWRLGGKLTDFEQNFNFSAQHDARIVSHNDTVTVISIFDNNALDSDKFETTSDASSFKIVALYDKESPKRAVLLEKFDRPDGEQTHLRGNGQYHSSSGGAFVGWSDQGYATEFASDGRLVQEFKFQAEQTHTYRTYKADFIGMPNSLPDLRTFASLNGRGETSMTSYVSWNGATEVATWEFFGSDDKEQGYESLGKVPRTGFETSFVAHAAWKYTWVQAKDNEGNILGESETMQTEHPASISIGAYEGLRFPSPTPIHESIQQPSVMSTFQFSAIIALLFVAAIAGLLCVGTKPVVRFLWKRFHVSCVHQHDYTLISGK